jgi:hypothetical protein
MDFLSALMFTSYSCIRVLNVVRKGAEEATIMSFREIHQRSLAFSSVSFNNKGTKSNMHAHNLAYSHISLDHGRHMWLLNSLDTAIVPMMIE